MKKAKASKANKKNQKRHETQEDEPLRRFQIYNQLFNNSINNMPAKLSELSIESKDSYKLSLLVFVTKLVGLANVAGDITLVDIKNSLSTFLSKVEENPKQLSNIILLDQNQDQYRLFSNHFNALLQDGFFTDKYKVISSIPVLQWFVDWFSVLLTCRLRVVRSVVLEIAHRLIKSCKRFCEEKDSIQKRTMKNFMIGICEVLRERTIDIDKSIRIKACDIILLIYQCLENEIITREQLDETFGKMIMDKREEISSLGVKYLNRLYQIEDSIVLLEFGKMILPRLYEICIKYNNVVSLSVDLLITLKRYSAKIEIEVEEVKDLILRVSKRDSSHLKILTQLFYVTVFEPYCKFEDIRKAKAEVNPKQILSDIICSFSLVDDLSLKVKIFQKMIEFDYTLFSVELLFELLYREELVGPSLNSFSKMNKAEMSSYLWFMFSYALLMRDNIQIDYFERQKRLEEYTVKLMEAGKQIFLDQIKELPSLSQDFIRLYTAIYTKFEKSDYQKEIDLIFEELQNIFHKSGQNPQLLNLILQALELIYPDGLKIILQNINIDKFYQADEEQLNKVSALSNFVDITERFPINTLSQLMPKFFLKNDAKIQISLMSILHHAHVLKLKALFKDIDQNNLDYYLQYRTSYINFIFNVFKKEQIPMLSREVAFKYACQTLSLVMHTKMSEIEILYFSLSDDLVDSMFLFLYQVIIGNGRSPEISVDEFFTKIQTVDEANINSDKLDLLNLVVILATKTIRFGVLPLPVKLLVTLLKSEKLKVLVKNAIVSTVKQEAFQENKDKFVFWRLFRAIVFSSILEEDESAQKMIFEELLSVYLNVNNFKTHKPIYIKKLIIFFAESIDEAFINKKFEDFRVLNWFFLRTEKRFSNDIISRLAGVTKHRFEQLEEAEKNKQCNRFYENFMHIAKRRNKQNERLKSLNKKDESSEDDFDENSDRKQKRNSKSSQFSKSRSQKSLQSRSNSVSSKAKSSSKQRSSKHSGSQLESNSESQDSVSRQSSPDISLRPRRFGSSRPTISKQKTKDKDSYNKPIKKKK